MGKLGSGKRKKKRDSGRGGAGRGAEGLRGFRKLPVGTIARTTSGIGGRDVTRRKRSGTESVERFFSFLKSTRFSGDQRGGPVRPSQLFRPDLEGRDRGPHYRLYRFALAGSQKKVVSLKGLGSSIEGWPLSAGSWLPPKNRKTLGPKDRKKSSSFVRRFRRN